MSQIRVTGNADIDTATAEIAVALRKACPVLCGEQDHYDEAMALRDAIMAGTRELDHEAALARADHGVFPHPQHRQPEHCNCEQAGVWGATGRMPEGHTWQTTDTGGYLAHV